MSNKPLRPNYAALLKNSTVDLPLPPDWLAPGKRIYTEKFGFCKVVAILERKLILQCEETEKTATIEDWQVAVDTKQIIVANQPIKIETNINLNQIEHPVFHLVATELLENLTAVETINPTKGELHVLPDDLPVPLSTSLKSIGVEQVYSHQLESLQALRLGQDICIVTPTASGKTWCFNIAVLESCLTSDATALYIYPLKALALDQFTKLRTLVQTLPQDEQVKIGLLTGDVPMQERQRLFTPNPPQILGVSPDLLNYQLYAVRKKLEGEQFRNFLRRLKYIVIDEAHTYLSSFGSNFANLIRRVRVAIDEVGGNSENLQYIFSSATVGNPKEMAIRFSGREDTPERLLLIDKTGAKSAAKTMLFLKPSASANPDASKIILSLLEKDLSGICFCNSRAAIKNLLNLIKQEATRNKCSHLADKIAVFYGGLTSDRRNNIVEKLRSGNVKWILSTSALEAGLDLPELDCCLLRGFPGSIMSFRQRLGRSGRRKEGLTIFLPVAQNHLDNYYSLNHMELLEGEAELVSFNPDYPIIVGKHLMASAVESGIPAQRLQDYFGEKAGAIANNLLNQNQLYLSQKGQLYGKGYPHRDINLRGSSLNAIKLIDSNTGAEIEQISSLDMAHREVFPDAIYIAQSPTGELLKYQSMELNVLEGKAILKSLDDDCKYFTKAESWTDIKILENLELPLKICLNVFSGEAQLILGWGEISSHVTGYKLYTKELVLCCTKKKCNCFEQPTTNKVCTECMGKTKYIEIVRIIDVREFEQSLSTKYETPIVQIKLNDGVVSSLNNIVEELKEEINKIHEEVPPLLKALWQGKPEAIALHSLGHQMVLALPLVILGSSLDINFHITNEGGTVGYFYDSTLDGNGSSEAIFRQFEKFANKAHQLASSCSCEYGCPKCLHIYGCPQDNEGLNKFVGMMLLNAII